jgi:hypothetical protein
MCTMALLHHPWPILPSSSCSMLPPSLLGVDCLSTVPPCLGGPALFYPLPLSCPHFPQVPGKALHLCWAQAIMICRTLVQGLWDKHLKNFIIHNQLVLPEGFHFAPTILFCKITIQYEMDFIQRNLAYFVKQRTCKILILCRFAKHKS